MKKKITQWVICSAIFTVGILSFLVLCGEDNPEKPMSLTQFFAYKIGAGVVIYFCYQLGRYCESKGLLPEMKEHDDEWED